jgi:hypothetical protein
MSGRVRRRSRGALAPSPAATVITILGAGFFAAFAAFSVVQAFG